ncbi:DUF4157 domain-containing protein [Halobaculum sp. MBLA0147]|uniref:eCIS core domain-containing protein n=1 Tax=Halobaculum sp. MBLA0147 TaxID=3079934 RepID=UPI0035260A13
MSRRSRRSRNRSAETNDAEASRTESGEESQRWPSDAAVGPNTAGPTTKEEAEAYYGREIDSAKEYRELQRLEKAYGGQVHRWIDEGIPLDAMGDQSKIQRFRERRDSEIPYDIEEFNQDSLDENTGRVARRVREGPAGETDVPDSVREVLSSPGRSLDPAVQRAVEERMGESFGDVRIHTGPKAAEAADEIDARAFTVGNHVAFGAGEYDPESTEGQHVLVHELAHVRQQTAGAVSMLPRDAKLDPAVAGVVGDGSREGGATVQRLLAGSALGVDALGATPVYLQRSERQPRRDNGEFGEIDWGEYEEKRFGRQRRPEYDEPGQRREVWERAKRKADNGVVVDPNTRQPLGTFEDYGDSWEMGHKPGREYQYLVRYYLLGVISEEEFVSEYQDPEHYHPEDPSANRSHEYERDGQYWADKWGDLEEHRDD